MTDTDTTKREMPPPEAEDETMQGADYRIKLENYYGPLDLLLYLIRKHELDICDISISDIAGQYIGYLEEIKKLDIDIASEFMVMAATLMRIKSRNLVPDQEEEFEEEEMEDPRTELIQNLIRYRKFKDRARQLRNYRNVQSRRFRRPDLTDRFRDRDDSNSPEKFEISLWQLIRRYASLQEQTTLESKPSIVYDDIPQEIVMDRILNRVENGESIRFESLIGSYPTRYKTVSYFLGILELARQEKIYIRQNLQENNTIKVSKRPESSTRPPSTDD